MFWDFDGNKSQSRIKWTNKEEEVVPFHREPEVRADLPKQQDNYLEHKREQLCIYLISKVTIVPLVKQLRHKLDRLWKVLDSILLQYWNEKEQRSMSLAGEEENKIQNLYIYIFL